MATLFMVVREACGKVVIVKCKIWVQALINSPLHFVFRLETFSFVSSSSHNLGLYLLFQEQTTSTGRLQYSNG